MEPVIVVIGNLDENLPDGSKIGDCNLALEKLE